MNRNSSFLFRVAGDSMEGVGIFDGDVIVVDKSIEPRHNMIVVAVIDGGFTVKRLFKKEKIVRLIPENPKYDPIDFHEGQEMQVWGVVTSCIRKLF
ncbi:S24 family peptidase [Oxalobacter vibrioformis]|uniref:S24 family peptidase n=1 Tax=Oxalobacter vibrioformis TaxID=933080 RepID=A0A9E9LX27_9BURK|nr:S24 family peptidase [Oxalobacter vibrioformis]